MRTWVEIVGNYLSKPHGGKLVNKVLGQRQREKTLDQIDELFRMVVRNETVNDIRNIAEGVFSPLEGFMESEDYTQVLREGRLANGVAWTIPIVLDAPRDICSSLAEGEDVVLIDESGKPVALLHLSEIYDFDKKYAVKHIFGTEDKSHPGVIKIFSMGELLLGGEIDLIDKPQSRYERYHLSPRETRKIFEKRKWRTVAGFQTRNIPHLGHEYIQKTALTFVDGIFINPIIGRKRRGDFRNEVVVAAYETLIENYFPEKRAVFGVLETEMRFAGPKEAIFHAIIRKNFGCTHFIVGRDHAGVGDFYPPYAAHDIFKEFPDLGITPLFFPSVFFCDVCKTITNDKACPHSQKCHKEFSGTGIREAIRSGDMKNLPIRPEVAEILMKWKEKLLEGEKLTGEVNVQQKGALTFEVEHQYGSAGN